MEVFEKISSSTKVKFFVKVFNFIYIAFCIIGLLYQSFLICDEYLSYSVTSSMTLTQQNVYKLPSLSMCFAIHEIFDYQNFNHDHNYNLSVNQSDITSSYISGLELLPFLTVSDVLKYTPLIDELFRDCEIRNSSNFQYRFFKSKKCYEWFHIEKYLVSTRLCYKITLRSTPSTDFSRKPTENIYYSLDKTCLTPADFGDIYFLFLNESNFGHFNYFYGSMHPTNSYPWIELALSQLRTRSYEPINGAIDDMFQMVSRSITTTKLPPPYITACQSYSTRTNGKRYRDSAHCFFDCITRKVTKIFGKASLANHWFEGNDMKLLTFEDFTDYDFNIKYGKILSDCQKLCPSNDCENIITYTVTYNAAHVSPVAYVSFPNQPSFFIDYGIKIKLLDTIIFILSCCGFWFGFSFYGFNPFNSKSKSRNKVESDFQINMLLLRERRKLNYLLNVRLRRIEDTLNQM